MAIRPTIAYRCCTALLAGLLALCAVAPVAAQTWEYSPYNVRLWIAVESTPGTIGLSDEVGREVASGARLASGVIWRIFPEPAPPGVRIDLLTRLGSLSPEQLHAAVPEAFQINAQDFAGRYVVADGDGERLKVDKLVIAAIRENEAGYQVQVRELDVATRQWSDLFTAVTAQRPAVPGVVLSNVVHAIRPLAKIERVEGRTLIARLRGSGLIVSPDSPAAIGKGQVMTPVVRRNKRNGEPLDNGIYAPAWSYVAVEERENTTIRGTISSGFGSVITVKGGPRTERLLLGLSPRYTTTRLELRARVPPSPGKGPPPLGRPLPGYEVYVKELGAETTELVGLTDWEGGIELSPGANPLRLFYIKNGGQMVARLPLVVGHQPRMTASVLDDDPRLAAEAYIKSLQSRVTDLVARRHILEVRIRAQLSKGEFAEAKELVAEFRSLPTSAQLTRELESAQQRMSNVSGVTGKRISQLFLDAHKLLRGFLDSTKVDKLANEVAEAERKGVPASAPPAETTTPAAPTT